MTFYRAALASLFKRPFLRNVAAVAGGTAAAQVIAMAFAPFITRIYGPETFGIQGTFLSLVAIVTPLSALAFPIAIVLPKADADAAALKRLSMLVALCIATLLLLVLLLFFDWIAALLGDWSIAPFLWLLPLVVILAAWFQTSQQWLIRKENFGVLARIAVVQAFLVNVARFGLGLLSATATMLIAITTIGLGLHAAMQWWEGRQRSQAVAPLASLRGQARLHIDFPLFRAPEMILNAISESLPVLMFATAFGPAEAGFYTLARSVLFLPLNLIGQSIADVFYPRLNAEALAGKHLLPILSRAWGLLAAIGAPLFGCIAFLSPWLFDLVFGHDWHRAGVYASIMCIWLFVMFVSRPCIAATSVMSMQKLFLAQGALTLVLRAAALWIGGYILADDIWTIGLFSFVSALAALTLIVLVALRAKDFSVAMVRSLHV